MSVEHDSWTVEREYPHPLAHVFAAWADPEVKRRWFDLSHSPDAEYVSDFTVGGTERWTTPPQVTPRVRYQAWYRDIVVDERIVAAYEITVDDLRQSVSLTTVEFATSPLGTRLRCTEQATFLDGRDTAAKRRGGLPRQLDLLAGVLDG